MTILLTYLDLYQEQHLPLLFLPPCLSCLEKKRSVDSLPVRRGHWFSHQQAETEQRQWHV